MTWVDLIIHSKIRVAWEERTSVEIMFLWDWPVGQSVWVFLFNDCSGDPSSQEAMHATLWDGSLECYKKAG